MTYELEENLLALGLKKVRSWAIYETIYQSVVMVRIFGNNFILSPPLVITSSHVKKNLSGIEAGLAEVS